MNQRTTMKKSIHLFELTKAALRFVPMQKISRSNAACNPKIYFKSLAALLLLFSSVACWADIQTFNTTSTWTAPAGVTKIVVECWGGGGAGGSATRSSGTAYGGGGAGGAYAKSTLTVVPG